MYRRPRGKTGASVASMYWLCVPLGAMFGLRSAPFDIARKSPQSRSPMPDPDEHAATEKSDLRGSPSADFTIAALAALAALEAAQSGQIELALRFGETLDVAKRALPYGKFRRWCTEVLRRSPSWCAAHLRLYRQRGDLEEARAWALAIDHRWAHVHSVERLLKIIAEWRASLPERDVRAARAKRSARRSQ
jgi:hypothetical protein